MPVPRLFAEKYELGETLGRGGMGDVYEATEIATHRRVAIKIMRRPDVSERAAETEHEWAVRFEREVRAIRGLRSPHVIELIDSGLDEKTGERFLVMERLDGEDLGGLLKRLGPLPIHLAIRIAAQTCLGLERAHATNVVHRDIKPGNLYLAKTLRGEQASREIRVLDFGIARMGVGADDADFTELTRTGSMLGSPHYIAPEQARGSKNVDPRADIWSLGVVLYRLLSGAFPHQDSDSGIGELLIAVCCKPAPSIQERAPWVPLEVARIVHRALLINREDRFESAREMYEALMAVLPDDSCTIDESMVVPLDDAARNVVAPRAVFADPGAMTLPDAEDRRSLFASSKRQSRFGGTPRLHFAVGGSAVLLAAVGFVLGGVALTRRSTLAHSDETFVAATTPRPETEPSPPTIASVPLRVPRGVRVVVDGAPASVEDDKVFLSGALGSTHSVTVLAEDGGERFETVVIAADGPMPSVIAAPAPRASQKAAPAASAEPAARARAPVGATQAQVLPAAGASGLRTTFE
ncbi:MAG TPA: serine/threonine-protein kinase [Labilithrix sp.]|nr:serine/threonine-protein kinase [Labilithrix sp.]